MLGGSLLQRLDRIFRDRIAHVPAHATAPVGGSLTGAEAVRQGDGAAGLLPHAVLSPVPTIAGVPLGEAHRGPLWRAVRWGGQQTLLVGPGVTLTLCPSGVGAIQAALSAVDPKRSEGGQS
ncbi:hypothetical protein [Sphingomonas sp. SRS2]|uniref:hypothetical protein n=1 Tax=Sphingomonas sp. SRS2 TaxID=133190 RepID=UPI0006183F25|nr:hypothetical protein [Sphingomonas sp. SRS2]KKC24909.1 hypothetical protein WP12_16940 [Sphingomonas sp. SRS2]